MNTTLEEEREEEQLLFCFDRADPIATIRLDRRISLSHKFHRCFKKKTNTNYNLHCHFYRNKQKAQQIR